jgi:putative RNA 2'-phosphotransferase
MSKDVSRLLSEVLRHKPNKIGIELDKNGYVKIGRLLDQLEVHDYDCDYEELLEIVKTNNKKRFEIKKADFGDNGYDDSIRASQGHSVKVDLKLKNQRPPSILYHGTVNKFLKNIQSKGLKKMNRHAVHLSEDIETASNVGSRRGEAIILRVFAGAMHVDGYKFQKSENGVWLTEEVPTRYFKIDNDK